MGFRSRYDNIIQMNPIFANFLFVPLAMIFETFMGGTQYKA